MIPENAERQLVRQLKLKDLNAFSILIDRYQGLVASIAFRMIRIPADREDVCQEIFIKVFEKIAGFREDAKLSTWIARIGYNHCLNYLRKNKPELLEEIDDDLPQMFSGQADTPEQELLIKDRRRLLSEMIDQLPMQQGIIVHLYHVQEFKYQEIAQIMKMPEGTVKNYLFRARKKLKENLAKYISVEDIQL